MRPPPPRAAFSHSASLGSLLPAQLQNAARIVPVDACHRAVLLGSDAASRASADVPSSPRQFLSKHEPVQPYAQPAASAPVRWRVA